MAKFGDIFEYWKDKAITEDGRVVVEVGYEGCDEKEFADMSKTIPVIVDWGEPCCFACGRKTAYEECKNYNEYLNGNVRELWDVGYVFDGFERAHILAKSLGGENTADNLFCLCRLCHRDSPDTRFKTEFFRWVFNRRRQRGNWNLMYYFRAAADECLKRGIAPLFGCENILQSVTSHGGRIEESSIIAALVGTAQENNDKLKSVFQSISPDHSDDAMGKLRQNIPIYPYKDFQFGG